MIRLTLESASYSELDFPRYNPEGFEEVHHAVELARQLKALADSPDELKTALAALREAQERKVLHQQIARRSFEGDRQRAFNALRSAIARCQKSEKNWARSHAVEDHLDHLITLYTMKEFDAVLRELPRVEQLLAPTPTETKLQPRAIGSSPSWTDLQPRESATSLFRRGLAFEQQGRIAEAVEAYERCLGRSPRHFQATTRLEQLRSRRSWAIS